MFYQVAALLSSILGFDSLVPSPETRLTADTLKPFDLARLVMACENQWRITLYDDQVLDCPTLGALAEHIEHMLADALDERAELTDEDRVAWFYE